VRVEAILNKLSKRIFPEPYKDILLNLSEVFGQIKNQQPEDGDQLEGLSFIL